MRPSSPLTGNNRTVDRRPRIWSWSPAGSWLLAVACVCFNAACALRTAPPHPELTAVGDQQDLLALSDALERLIDLGQDRLADREYAYAVAHKHNEDTAATMFARAAITGRLVQQKGLRAARLIPEIERCARRSRELDADFRGGV